MRLPFMRKEDRDSNFGDEHAGEDYPVVDAEGSGKGGSILFRVTLYIGVFLALVIAVGGYYYLNYIRGTLNRRISGNPSGLVRAIDIEGGKDASAPRETTFIEGQACETAQPPGASSPDERARELSPANTGAGAQDPPGKPSVKKTPAPPGTIPSPPEKVGRTGAVSTPSVSPDQSETLLGHLVLRDDNPFREKFLKRFQDARGPKLSPKERGSSARSGRMSRPQRSGLTGGELPILPDITDGGDRPGDLKVVGVIQTREASIALTNRGELKVGSLVDGDAVTSITINEVHLKSGRTLKVTAQ